jgi:hypothetical protein
LQNPTCLSWPRGEVSLFEPWGVILFIPGFFFLRILWCSQGGDHPETNLANSGYMPDMNLFKKNQDPSIFLATWNLLWKNWRFEFSFLFEIWRMWTIFPMKNPLYQSKSYFSGRILALKKTGWFIHTAHAFGSPLPLIVVIRRVPSLCESTFLHGRFIV